MANYSAAARSNVFIVKDVVKFIADIGMAAPEVTVEHRSRWGDIPGQVMMYSDCPDTGSWPSHVCWEDPENDPPAGVVIHDDDGNGEIDWAALVAPHLVEGQVCVMMESGHEKLRYVCGFSRAIYSDGRSVTVSLHDIYEKAAAEFGVSQDTITECAY